VVRKLGGTVVARNLDLGASVTLRLPVSALALDADVGGLPEGVGDGD
jgi:hypothetical protein